MSMLRALPLVVLPIAVFHTQPAHAVTYAGKCVVSVSSATIACDSALGSPVWLESGSGSSFTLGVDMSNFLLVSMKGSIQSGSGWLLNVGDSETNNGYCGDGATTSNDSELWIQGTGVYLCDSDRGGSKYLWRRTGAVAGTDKFDLSIYDGSVTFRSNSAGSATYSSSTIFQIDGDEPDAEAGANDSLIWIGVNRVISGPSGRTGTGMQDFILYFWK